MEAASADWTSFTFVVLDADSANDRKCILCYNAPERGKKGDELLLRNVRIQFAEAAVSMFSF